jgi:hypothetical protein
MLRMKFQGPAANATMPRARARAVPEAMWIFNERFRARDGSAAAWAVVHWSRFFRVIISLLITRMIASMAVPARWSMRDVSAADFIRLRLKEDRAVCRASFLEVAQVVKTARQPEN